MDKALRMEILSMTVTIRRRLEEEIRNQLESTYGMNQDGRYVPIAEMPTMSKNQVLAQERQDLESAVIHIQRQDANLARVDAHLRFIREVAFTYLNRLAALRMMEARKLIPESVGKGMDSTGFKTFQTGFKDVTPTLEAGYERYLQLFFDEVGVELPSVFDRSLPTSIIFPSPLALKDILAELNRPELAEIWLEDETIGWIYQYFTPKEQREEARAQSQAPRNSYELSFRNQFYTPAYVVRFLTDNTLGRLWYEMNQKTSLVELCPYLVRQPGEAIAPRPKKDPREIRVLDPACGSGHFLLYAFDLLAAIYTEEGYDLSEIPALILAHNLYGIDIDLRATQITSLALYLKAKKHHPGAKVRQTNIVCAEPMPGDEALFHEFLKTVEQPALKRLATGMWKELELASEAGSLLKAELSLQRILASEKKLQEARPFLADTDEGFWQNAEGELVGLLNRYATHALQDASAARRLFAREGLEGLRFLDVLRTKFDVVLMNPPFGDASKPSKAYVEKNYPRTKNDVYAAFVERGLGLLHRGGKLGAITSRTGFFLSSFQKWREEILLKEARPTVMADLGQGVLDTAMVETAAYCLEVI